MKAGTSSSWWRPQLSLILQVRFLGEIGSMSPSNFSLIAETTSCHEEETGGGRDSSVAGETEDGVLEEPLESPHGQRLLILSWGPENHISILLHFLVSLLFFIWSLRERLWRRESSLSEGNQGVESWVRNTGGAPRGNPRAASGVEQQQPEGIGSLDCLSKRTSPTGRGCPRMSS